MLTWWNRLDGLLVAAQLLWLASFGAGLVVVLVGRKVTRWFLRAPSSEWPPPWKLGLRQRVREEQRKLGYK